MVKGRAVMVQKGLIRAQLNGKVYLCILIYAGQFKRVWGEFLRELCNLSRFLKSVALQYWDCTYSLHEGVLAGASELVVSKITEGFCTQRLILKDLCD